MTIAWDHTWNLLGEYRALIVGRAELAIAVRSLMHRWATELSGLLYIAALSHTLFIACSRAATWLMVKLFPMVYSPDPWLMVKLHVFPMVYSPDPCLMVKLFPMVYSPDP